VRHKADFAIMAWPNRPKNKMVAYLSLLCIGLEDAPI